ncbi:hypothetical protein RFI_08245 [Reticulomyxa filosa]|uniref:Uncharacterized protein n=1 Tax=Reticulomyxa filosa TaxID=46433 RepID=X6NSD7_RETFI|nr:hypothetical protein RFI_08245 [Reticulomyxa filosa]|eukprot:ETO28881.1 hypothetical protein RFI_08245 [Reticulomyxa filosa]
MSYYEVVHYWNNPTVFQELFQLTPSEDEMHCYRELMNIVYDERDTRNTVQMGGMTHFFDAMSFLRKEDNAIAHDNRGWIFTIDNLLCILLYRDYHCFHKTNLLGELQLSLTVQLENGKTLKDLENRNALYIMKEAIIKGYKGIPSLTEEDHIPDINCNDIILRKKTALRKWYDLGFCNTPTLVHLTFGIRVDDTQLVYRYKPQLVFQHIAFALSRHILDRRSFLPMFQRHVRGKPVGCRLLDVKPSELEAFPYPDYVSSFVPRTRTQTTANPADFFRNMTTANNEFSPSSTSNVASYGFFSTVDIKREFSRAFQEEELLLDTEQYVSKIIERSMVFQLGQLVKRLQPRFLFELMQPEGEPEPEPKSKPEKEEVELKADKASGNEGDMTEDMKKHTVKPSSTKEPAKQGHMVCCYKCELTFAMLALAILLSGVVASSGYISWKVLLRYLFILLLLLLSLPLYATVKGVMNMGNAVLGNSTASIASQSLFASHRFLDFSTSILLPVNNLSSLEILYNNYFKPTIVEPTIDGVFGFIKHGNNNVPYAEGMMLEEGNLTACQGFIGNLTCRKYTPGMQLQQVGKAFQTDALDGVLNDTWAYRNEAAEADLQRLYWFNDKTLNGTTSSVWMMQLRYNADRDQMVAVIVRSSQISMKYKSLDLRFNAVVYWVSDDDNGDVFVSSMGDEGYQITEHVSNGSNIALSSAASTLGTGQGRKATAQSKLIVDTVKDLKKWRNDDNNNNNNNNNNNTIIIMWDMPMVICMKVLAMHRNANNAFNVVVALTCFACVFAAATGFISQAVPVIPRDERYRLHPFLTIADKEDDDDEDHQPHSKQAIAKAKVQKEYLLSEIREIHRDDDKNNEASKVNLFRKMTNEQSAQGQEMELAQLNQHPKTIETTTSSPITGNGHAPNSPKRDETNTTPGFKSKCQQTKTLIGKCASLGIGQKKTEIYDVQFNVNAADSARNLITGNDNINNNNNNNNIANNDAKDTLELTSIPPARSKRAQTLDDKADVGKLSLKQARKEIKNWKKEEEKKQMQSNIKRQLMRSIFNRESSQWQTKWGLMASRVQTILAILVLLCIGFSYLGCRTLSSHAIDDIKQNFISISARIGELGMEFEYFKGRLFLQNYKDTMQQLYHNSTQFESSLSSYWPSYEIVGVVTVENTLYANDDSSTLQITSAFASVNGTQLSLNTNTTDDCINWSVDNSYSNIKYVRDCAVVSAADELTSYLRSHNGTIAWSKPYACFDGQTVCYLGLYQTLHFDKDSSDSLIYLGVLISFQKVSAIGIDQIWQASRLPYLKHSHGAPSTMAQLNFSMFAITNARYNLRYDNASGSNSSSDSESDSEWYLIASTANNLITQTKSPYGQKMYSVTHADTTDDLTVSSVTDYLIQPSPDQIPTSYQLVVLKQIFGYPAIGVYSFKDPITIPENENWAKLDWIFVLSVSLQVFTGDFEQYAALAIICVGGALIVLCFVLFVFSYLLHYI